MNALKEKSRRLAFRRSRSCSATLALVVVAAVQLAACADIRRATSLPPVNPESPVAGVVAAAAMQTFRRPSLASVPPKPLNVPAPAAVKTAVIDMVRCRRAYEVWAAAHPAQVSGSGAFAEALQARLDNNPQDRPTPADEAAAEAEAAKLRAYAEPPPAIPSGPPLTAAQAAAPAAPPVRPTAQGPQHRAAPARTAAAASSQPSAPQPPGPPSAAAVRSPAPPGPEPAPASAAAPQVVAVVQPSMTPLYEDPVLAHCQ